LWKSSILVAVLCSNLGALDTNPTLKFGVKMLTLKNFEWRYVQNGLDYRAHFFVKDVLSRYLIVLHFALNWGKTQSTIRV